MCEQDDAWSGSRYFSEAKISKIYEERPALQPPTEERDEELRLIAEQAIRTSLEPADAMEAA